jgi:hypothetical protein
MKPENRALSLVGLGVTVVLVVGCIGIFSFDVVGPPPAALPIPAGTVFTREEMLSWTVPFNVHASGMRLEGAWTAFNATFDFELVVANGTVNPSWGGVCPNIAMGTGRVNGTLDTLVDPGPHSLFWEAYCGIASRAVVTETVQLVPA